MLRQKVKDFEKKYEMLIPEVEKLRQNLSSKSITVEQLEAKLDRLKRDQMRSLEEITSEK